MLINSLVGYLWWFWAIILHTSRCQAGFSLLGPIDTWSTVNIQDSRVISRMDINRVPHMDSIAGHIKDKHEVPHRDSNVNPKLIPNTESMPCRPTRHVDRTADLCVSSTPRVQVPNI